MFLSESIGTLLLVSLGGVRSSSRPHERFDPRVTGRTVEKIRFASALASSLYDIIYIKLFTHSKSE